MPETVRPGESFFTRPPIEVAYDLLGCLLVSDRPPARTVGRIVEVEAYAGPDDLASHAGKYAAGRAAMFGPPGRAYVYRSYGIHTMLNVVAHEMGRAGAILIRAIEPVDGLPTMAARRGLTTSTSLASGPGRLCQAMAIYLTDDGLHLASSDQVWIEHGAPLQSVLCAPRIGISQGREVRWRLFASDNRFVSLPRRGEPIDPASLPDAALNGTRVN
ncbi:MAG: DNA-3-methyladenine glycosylase [Chloroflexota bacterium]|nr:DNA-3-methyladenine glycosylase [Chloroflexota bacterium]